MYSGRLKLLWAVILAVGMTVVLPAQAAGALQADELLLVYNRLDPQSADLANYYAKVRNVPSDRLCPLDLKSNTDDISRDDFERLIRKPIRDYLTAHRLRDKVRCLVTFWGLPIRVGAQRPWPDAASLRAKWQQEKAVGRQAFEQILAELDAMSGAPAPATRPASQPAESESHWLRRRYVTSKQATFEGLSRRKPPGGSEQERSRFAMLIAQVEGAERLLAFLSPAPGVDRAVAEKGLNQQRQQIRSAAKEASDLLARDLGDPARDRGRQILGQVEGLIAYLESLDSDLARLETNQSEAAVDNELMLLWWGSSPLHRWVWNPLSWRNQADPELVHLLPPGDRERPVMIVARLDGPTPLVVRRMIDDSAAVEKTGLSGRFYIDARGLRPDQGLGGYDQNLRELSVLARGAGLQVTLDNRSEVFRPGQCPDAALYCGWYSLRKYVGAFSFVPGAVGFHIASFEAIDLKKPGETGWCRGLLLDGMAATIGPVAEPYLQSFPLPTDFFGLLLTGRFTLGECYAYSLPFTSWMQMLLGDPLYNPFALKPAVSLEKVFDSRMMPPEFRPPAKQAHP